MDVVIWVSDLANLGMCVVEADKLDDMYSMIKIEMK